jgi:2-succinyl-5-enolpyruvyl-6-hydroxy-3-cyclohexene-1-carboxylate synthase
VASADLLLRDHDFAASHTADFVLRFGATPTSKSLRQWLERRPPRDLVLVDAGTAWHDPSHLASEVLRVDATALCDLLVRRLASEGERGRSPWLRGFLEADARARAAIEAQLGADSCLLEARVVRELAEAVPDDALLYVSNSMPIRDLDAFLPASPGPLRVLCNRGANGIDGMVSSALGAAAAGTGPVVLLSGDLALLHDSGGLLAARRLGVPLVIVVLDNDGGGIFSRLPIADHGDSVAFQEHFRTPHGLDLGALCRGIGLEHAQVESAEHLRATLKDALAGSRVRVLSVPLDPERSAARFQEMVEAVAAGIRAPERMRRRTG